MRGLVVLVAAVLAGCQAQTTADAVAGPVQPVAGEPTFVVQAVGDIHGGAEVRLSVADDMLYVDAISPGGIGSTRIRLTSGRWPARLAVRLFYGPDRPFGRLEGAGACLELTGTRDDERDCHLYLVPKAANGFAAQITPDKDLPVLYIHWVDAYRR